MINEKTVIRKKSPEEILRESDEHTLSQRALRLRKIESFRKIPQVATLRVFDHLSEAKSSFINACYRSCIICLSNAIEQTFIHELVNRSEDWERKYWEIEIKQMNFYDIIKEIKREKDLARFAKHADWLRKVRNIVVAHPSYVSHPDETDKPDKTIWQNKIMLRDLKQLLSFFPKTKRMRLENTKLTARRSDGTIIDESESLRDFINNPEVIEHYKLMDWWAFQKGLLYELALEAYEKASRILKEMYPVKKPTKL